MGWSKVGEAAAAWASTDGDPFGISLPGTPTQGDLVVVQFCQDNMSLTNSGATTAINTSGYTNIGVSFSAHLPDWQVAYKILGASPDGSVSMIGTGHSLLNHCAIVQVWRSTVAASIQLDAVSASAATGTSGMPDPPAATVSANSLVFAAGFLDDDNAASGSSAPSGYSNFVPVEAGSNAEDSCSAFLASKIGSAGSENPGAFSGSGSDNWVAVTFSFIESGTTTASSARLLMTGCGA